VGYEQAAAQGQPPLTPEYQAIYEANLKDQAEGGQGTDPTFICIPDGMPRAMNVIFPMEIVIQPKTTHMMIEYRSMLRRVFTTDAIARGCRAVLHGLFDRPMERPGRGRPLRSARDRDPQPERSPSFDASGIPLHADNRTIVKERLYLDKADPNLMLNEVTTIDNALDRPPGR